MNWSFSVGTFAFAVAAIFPLIYLASYAVRAMAARMKNEVPPDDRVWEFVAFYIVVGFAFGCLTQPQWDGLDACRSKGKSIAACLLPRM